MKKNIKNCAALLLACMSVFPFAGCSAGNTNGLTREAAQEVVLNHAGFTEEEVKWLWTKYDRFERVPHYDVQFRQGRLEYEYEVHGETGEILSVDVDD